MSSEGTEKPLIEPALADESRIARLRGREAVAIGKRLIRKHPDFAAGYELAARGYEDQGRPRSAIRVLERGLARRPADARLLESLAIRYSDAGRLDEALVLLDRALAETAAIAPAPTTPAATTPAEASRSREAPRSAAASLHYNRALLLVRMDRKGAALSETWQALEIDPTLTRAALLAAALECAIGQLEPARERLEATVERLLATAPERRDNAALSDACRALAEIELAYHRKEHALELFRRALEFEKHNAAARYWIRELSGERNPNSCYWRIVIRGRWPAGCPLPDPPPEGRRPGLPAAVEWPASGPCLFSTLYDVVAETPEEALELIRLYEPPDVRSSLVVDSAKIMRRSVSDPKGVYRTTPYDWHPRA